MKKTGLIWLFLFTFLLSSLHCQIDEHLSLKGKALSDFLYEEISLNGYRARKSQICRSDKNNFPYNIVISIRQTQGFSLPEERQYNSVMFVFSQDEIVQRLDYLYDLINFNLNTDFGFNVSILLSASDIQPLSGNEEMTGTELYCENIEGSESVCAVPVNFSSRHNNSITPGAENSISPLWLLKLTTNSLEKSGLNFPIKGGSFVSLYKIGILKMNTKLSSFLSREIPACEINFKNDFSEREKFDLFFSSFLNGFSEMETFEDDFHYIPVRISKKTFYIRENFTISILLILITINLIIFSDLGFIFRKKHSRKNLLTKRAVHSIYLIPLTIIVSTFCLELSQKFSGILFSTVIKNPVLILGIKIIISITLISFAYLIELKFHHKASDHIYGYLTSISSLLNIFIFSAIDITLFYIFTVIYLILLLSRFFKNTIVIYFFIFLSIVPFFQLVYEVLLNTPTAEIMNLIISKPLYNITLSCALTPIYISILRILVNINSKEHKKQISGAIKSRFPKYYALIQTTTITAFVLIFLIIGFIIRKSFYKRFDMLNIYGTVKEVNFNHYLVADYYDTNYYGGTIRQILVDTQKLPARVEIFVSGQTDNPVYYTTYSYKQLKNSSKVQFILPDYPPSDISISYTPDNSLESTIEVYAYYDKDIYSSEYIQNEIHSESARKTYIKEKQIITIRSKAQGQK